MGKSFKIGTLFGIPIKIHWSFPLLIALAIFYIGSGGVDIYLLWGGLIAAVFVCVILHELGHALSARRYGVNTIDIILSPIGGVARLTKLPTKPIQEFIVAAAGPMVNVVIATVIAICLLLFTENGLGISWASMEEGLLIVTAPDAVFWRWLMTINIILVIFNLIPAFPMDGGRMFRSLLSIKLGRLKATNYAANLGKLMAIFFGIYGFFNNPVLIFIGVFVFVSATSEYRMVRTNEFLALHKVREVVRQVVPISITATIQEAASRLMNGQEEHLIVVDETLTIKGVLLNKTVIKALADKANDKPLAEYVSQSYQPIHPDMNIKEVLYLMQNEGYMILPVFENEFLGIVDWRGINEFLKFHNTLREESK